MTEQETITVASVSDGRASVGTPGTDVTLPVVELLTGRGFVTGKSGSGKSNTASVVVENLLDLGFPVLIVDIDGEYYGLKEQYEILHVGADEECDIRVSDEQAEKVADLALNQNVPIILDVSSFLDESAAADLLTEVTRHLFAKEKKLKKPFLIVVEEIHEYLPEGGGLDECGRMLVKVGKRGRKHGLGICGISQRPADVKKDFITQCDWLCWHRLTWRNDTKVVKRVLGNEYADAVEGLDDGEAFLATDWSDAVRRVQFHRKRTFDAGATPGLDDFQRPDLKSVSDDLVNKLAAITEEERHRADEIDRLRQELREKERRIEMLEKDLENARDLRNLADQFAAALFDHPGRSRMQLNRERAQDADRDLASSGARDTNGDRDSARQDAGGNGFPAVAAWSPAPDRESNANHDEDEVAEARSQTEPGASPTRSPPAAAPSEAAAASADSAPARSSGVSSSATAGVDRSETVEAARDSFDDLFADSTPWPDWGDSDAEQTTSSSTQGESSAASNRVGRDGDEITFDILGADHSPDRSTSTESTGTSSPGRSADSSAERSAEPASGVLFSGSTDSGTGNGDRDEGRNRDRSAADSAARQTDGLFAGLGDDQNDDSDGASEGATVNRSSQDSTGDPPQRAVVRQVRRVLESADAVTLGMLVRYRRQGPLAPEDAHVAAGGDGDRTKAYSRNSTLRQAGLVTHAGRGRYEYVLRELVERTHDDRLSSGRVDAIVEQIEQELLLSPLDA